MADTYKERFSRRDLTDISKPVTWTVAGFTRGNDRVNATKPNNHVFLKRIIRSGVEVTKSFPTAQIVVGVIKCVKATDVIL